MMWRKSVCLSVRDCCNLLGAVILLTGTIIILFSTNVSLAWTAMPILPVALVLFMIFGSASQPLFIKVQQKLSTLNTILQENLAGVKVVKAFTREKEQQTKFRTAADDTMNQAITVSRLFTFLFPLVFLIANLRPGCDPLFWRQTDHHRFAEPR